MSQPVTSLAILSEAEFRRLVHPLMRFLFVADIPTRCEAVFALGTDTPTLRAAAGFYHRWRLPLLVSRQLRDDDENPRSSRRERERALALETLAGFGVPHEFTIFDDRGKSIEERVVTGMYALEEVIGAVSSVLLVTPAWQSQHAKAMFAEWCSHAAVSCCPPPVDLTGFTATDRRDFARNLLQAVLEVETNVYWGALEGVYVGEDIREARDALHAAL